MHRATHRRASVAAVLALGLLSSGLLGRVARADRQPPTVAIQGARDPERVPLPSHDGSTRLSSTGAPSTGGWWFGTVGIAVALAVFGAVSIASKRYLPHQGSGSLRVVGRTSLSPKHTVYLLKAGERVLIVGAGPQGAPSLLGELTDPVEIERLNPRRQKPTPPPPPASPAASGSLVARFDRRVGDDE